MSCTQASIFLPNVKFGVPYLPSCSPNFYLSRLNVSAIHRGKSHKVFPGLVCCNQSKHNRRFGSICATENAKNKNEGFSWESLKNAMEQQAKVQYSLKGHKRKQEFGENGGDGGRRGGGGGGDGGGDGSDGQEDGGLPAILDEMQQMVLATIGFIVVYAYLVRGAELTRLTRDYIKYLIDGIPSIRMIRAMEEWEEFKTIIISTVEAKKEWLARAIATMLTWWHKPGRLVESMREFHAIIISTVEQGRNGLAQATISTVEAGKEWLARAIATMLTRWHNQRKLVELRRKFYASIVSSAEARKGWLARAIAVILAWLPNPRKLVELMSSGECLKIL